MLVRVTRQGGSVLDEVFGKTAAEMTKKPRLGGMLDERCYTAIAQKPSTGCISQYPSFPPNKLLGPTTYTGAPIMINEDWSNAEKKIARVVFDHAVKTELDEVVQAVKKKSRGHF